MRKAPLVTGHVYHVFNRGVNRQDIFFGKPDYKRFFEEAVHYKTKDNKFSYERSFLGNDNETGSLSLGRGARVEILAYCLMPNHFHFLIRQLEDGGITNYMRRLANGYAHYINVKYKRVGHLFTRRFKNVLIETDEQLLHVSRYIHLNPFVSGIVKDLKTFSFPSSYLSYLGENEDMLCDGGEVLRMFKSAEDYEKFVLDQADYGKKLEEMKHLLLDLEQ